MLCPITKKPFSSTWINQSITLQPPWYWLPAQKSKQIWTSCSPVISSPICWFFCCLMHTLPACHYVAKIIAPSQIICNKTFWLRLSQTLKIMWKSKSHWTGGVVCSACPEIKANKIMWKRATGHKNLLWEAEVDDYLPPSMVLVSRWCWMICRLSNHGNCCFGDWHEVGLSAVLVLCSLKFAIWGFTAQLLYFMAQQAF